jgi:hypothetical protein
MLLTLQAEHGVAVHHHVLQLQLPQLLLQQLQQQMIRRWLFHT